MIALLVARGFPRSVQPADLSLDPSVRFQWTCLQEAVSAANREITSHFALGVGVDERIEANHPVLRAAFIKSVTTQQRMLIDNVARLFDNHDWDSALAFQKAIQKSDINIFCALQGARLEELDQQTLRVLILDRLHQSKERQAAREFRKTLQKQNVRAKPKASAGSPSQATEKLALYDEIFISIHIHKLCNDWITEDLSSPFTVKEIVDGLNEKGIQTQRGKPWTPPNLRKFLRVKRKTDPESKLWDLIKLPKPTEF